MPEDIFVNNVIKVLPSESLYSSQLKQVSKQEHRSLSGGCFKVEQGYQKQGCWCDCGGKNPGSPLWRGGLQTELWMTSRWHPPAPQRDRRTLQSEGMECTMLGSVLQESGSRPLCVAPKGLEESAGARPPGSLGCGKEFGCCSKCSWKLWLGPRQAGACKWPKFSKVHSCGCSLKNGQQKSRREVIWATGGGLSSGKGMYPCWPTSPS